MKNNNNAKNKPIIRTVKKLMLILIPSLIIGFILGFSMSIFGDRLLSVDITDFFESFNLIAYYAVPAIFLAVFIAITVACLSLNKKGKAIFEKWDGEDEETIAKAEKALSISSCLASVGMIVMCFLFGLWAYFLGCIQLKGNFSAFIVSAAFILIFLASIIFFALISSSVVELVKKINPEKKGSALDVKFNKEWIDSCDEAEKLSIYKSGFTSYRVTNNLCIFLWIICVFSEMAFSIGVLPLVIVSAIWLTSTITYFVTAFRLENKK